MVDEVLRALITDPDGVYLDATIGGGGHAELLLEHLHRQGCLIGLDRDPDAVAASRERLARFGDRVRLFHADFRSLAAILEEQGVSRINAALLDLGLSSLQLDNSERGFAYRFDGPLDLRFDRSNGQTAAEWLAHATTEEIARVFREYGEERHAARLARLVVTSRDRDGVPIRTTGDLTALVTRVTGPRGDAFGRTAARVLQALRIVVNDELAAIPVALEAALDRLAPGGRLVVIAYHSLEDRIVKTFFREVSRVCRCPKVLGRCVCGANPRGRLVHRHVLKPSAAEVAANPRARSARMRVLERLPSGQPEDSREIET